MLGSRFRNSCAVSAAERMLSVPTPSVHWRQTRPSGILCSTMYSWSFRILFHLPLLGRFRIPRCRGLFLEMQMWLWRNNRNRSESKPKNHFIAEHLYKNSICINTSTSIAYCVSAWYLLIVWHTYSKPFTFWSLPNRNSVADAGELCEDWNSMITFLDTQYSRT